MATDSRFFFSEYRITGEAALNVFGRVVGFYLIPGFFWWGIKSLAAPDGSASRKTSGATRSRRGWTAPMTWRR